MHIYKKLYCDEKTAPQKKKIIRKIKYHGGLLQVYVIAVSAGPDYFEVIPGHQFKQKAYPIQDLMIMGLAGSYDDAIDLITRMLEDLSVKYGTYQFKKSFMDEKEMNFTGYNRK